jgi:glycosyltransferase involved in cell wall biosynthesis
LAGQQGVEDLLEWQSFKDEAELTEEYQKSRLCVIPYTGYAGYFPAAYALGNGVPIVATDILGRSEYVGDAGLLVPPSSPEDLAAAIKRVLNDDALITLLGANGRRRAEETLSWGTVASQTLEFFNEVMGGRGERAAS